MTDNTMSRTKRFLIIAAFILGGIVLNFVPSLIVRAINLPIYLDSLGTILTAMFGGSFPAVLVGFFSNVANSTFNENTFYFGVVNALIAYSFAWSHRMGMFKKVGRAIVGILTVVLIGVLFGSTISWFTSGFGGGPGGALAKTLFETGYFTQFTAQLTANFLIDLGDKTFVVVIAIAIYHFTPQKIKDFFYHLFNLDIYESANFSSAKKSLLKKVVTIILMAELVLGTLACTISAFLYNNAAVEKYSTICEGVTADAAIDIDPDKIDYFLEKGKEAEGYYEVENHLYGLKNSFPQIEFIYVYKVDRNGCHVVFDIDTGALEGEPVGTVIPFDESFEEIVPKLLRGEKIDPIITNDTYGYLLTYYRPLYNSAGKCVCYVCADITMSEIITDEITFLTKMISLFFGVSIVIMCIIIEIVKNTTISPLNKIADAARRVAFDTERGRRKGLEHLKKLEIRSEDEIENLYLAIFKMAEDSAKYIDQVQKIQEGIILDFANLVESRDQSTGDHIKNIANYVNAMATELRAEGKYRDTITDEYIHKLVRSAPLHDIGKIKISDLILNKPGKLNEYEFEIMKTHAEEGARMLEKSSSMAEGGALLSEAINIAKYHHERWDGTGYPEKLRGEQIPLSARIVAVADVFDALVSRRCYKDPFPFEKAIEIIKEESGTHFDPTVAEAFIKVAEKAYNENIGKS